MSIGEGAAFLVLEEARRCQARGGRVRARLLGAGMSTDAHHVTAPHPEGEGMIRAIAQSLDAARLTPREVQYANAHGTGTPQNDRSEALALCRVFGEGVDLLDIVRRIAEFFRDESCGQCVPCRVGTVRQEEWLARLRAARSRAADADELALLRDLGQVMRDASICGLGQTASSAVESAIFRLSLGESRR